MDQNVPVILMDLPTTVHAFICLGEDFMPCIVVNARISAEQQRKAFLHELSHLINGDMDDESYNEYGDAV
jgi:Zn-dependent peptidase ImmA (M78 family)